MNLSQAWETVESYGYIVRIRHNCDWVVIEAPSGKRKSCPIIEFINLAYSLSKIGFEEYFERWSDEQKSEREPEKEPEKEERLAYRCS